MADEVAISNMAVALLGDEATISSISPAEGSEQAEHCEMFFPIARDALLEMAPWDFATSRVTLTPLSLTRNGWRKVYQRPTDCIKVHGLLPPDAGDDYSLSFAGGTTNNVFGLSEQRPAGQGLYTPVPFKCETMRPSKTRAILANIEDADAICTFRETDTTRFSPLFTSCMGYLLAHYIAGPIYKGETGVQMSAQMLKLFQQFWAKAVESNADQERYEVQQVVPWMSNR